MGFFKYNEIFNETKFFPDSKLNYAENILKKRTSEVAINFLSENKIIWMPYLVSG